MTNQFATFYIIRHGETESNAKRILQGHTDVSLNETGRKQATNAAQKLSHIKFDIVFSSDLLRAKETAEIIVAKRKLDVSVTKVLRERSYGIHEGTLIASLWDFNAYFDSLTHAQKRKNAVKGGETYDEVAERLFTFLRETAITHPNKTILVTTHGDVIRAMLVSLGFATFDNLTHGSIANASYVKLKTDGVDFFVEETEGINLIKDQI